MRQEKYLEKVIKKIEKELKKRGLSEDFRVAGRIEDRVPIIIIDPTDRTTDRVYVYNLANEYITYLEEDVSVAESFKEKRDSIFEEITVRREVLPAESFEQEIYEEEQEEKLNDLNDSFAGVGIFPPEEDITLHDSMGFALVPMSGAYYNSLCVETPDIIALPMGDAYATLSFIGINGEYSFVTERDAAELGIDTEHTVSVLKDNIDNMNFEIMELNNLLYNGETSSGMYGVYSLPINDSLASLIMLSDKAMQTVAEKIGTNDFYLIPSSVHELIAVASSKLSNRLSIERTYETIAEVNSELPHNEQLSESLLKYNFETKEIESISKDELFNRLHIGNDEVEFEELGNEEEINEEESYPTTVEPFMDITEEDYAAIGINLSEITEENQNMEINHDLYLEFEDFDTDYAEPFARKMKELFEWKEPSGIFEIQHRNIQGQLSDNYYLVDGNGIEVNLSDANNTYQTNSQSFLEIGLDLFADYKDKLVESILNTSTERDSGSLLESAEQPVEQEEFEEGYFPFE